MGSRFWIPLLLTSAFAAHAAVAPLRFRADGTFKILQIADTHYENGIFTSCSDILPSQLPCSDLNSTAFIARLLAEEAPDLIVASGDNIDGGAFDARAAMDAVFALYLNYSGGPWAAVLGNHDQESSLNRSDVMAYIISLPNTVSQFNPEYVQGDIHGFGNYYLQVLDVSSNASLLNLYMLDSGDYSKYAAVGGYDWVWANQISWFMNTSLSLQAASMATTGSVPPALAYFHIPVPEYNTVLQAGLPIVGVQQEAVSSASVNSGLFTAFLQAGDVKATSVGHDHVNDYATAAPFMGVHLTYAGGTGYHAYGKAGWPRRARVMHVADFGDTITTYKRLDDDNMTVLDTQTLYSALPLANMTVVAGSSVDTPCPAGFDIVQIDLNHHAGGDYVYTCLQRAVTDTQVMISSITTVASTDATVACPTPYTRIDTNCKSGTNSAYYIYICIATDDVMPTGSVVTDLTVAEADGVAPACPVGYVQLSQNMNEGTAGAIEYLCVKSTPWASNTWRWSPRPLPRLPL